MAKRVNFWTKHLHYQQQSSFLRSFFYLQGLFLKQREKSCFGVPWMNVLPPKEHQFRALASSTATFSLLCITTSVYLRDVKIGKRSWKKIVTKRCSKWRHSNNARKDKNKYCIVSKYNSTRQLALKSMTVKPKTQKPELSFKHKFGYNVFIWIFDFQAFFFKDN